MRGSSKVSSLPSSCCRDPMDFFDCLMYEQPEKDYRRSRGCEIVLAKELILSWARLVDFEVAGETVGTFHWHALLQHESLSCQQVLLHIWPLRKPLPNGRKVSFLVANLQLIRAVFPVERRGHTNASASDQIQ